MSASTTAHSTTSSPVSAEKLSFQWPKNDFKVPPTTDAVSIYLIHLEEIHPFSSLSSLDLSPCRCQILNGRSKSPLSTIKNSPMLPTACVNFSLTFDAPACRKADVSRCHTNRPHNQQVTRSDVPQCADEAIRGSFCVQGADVPNVQEAGHLVRHGGRSREECLQWEG